MKKVVIFDLDGTLINSLPDIAGSMNRVLAANRLPIHPVDAYKRFTGDGARVLAQRALGNRQDMLDKVLAAYAADYAQNSRVDTRPYEGMADALKRLSDGGYAVCVYSNKDDADTQNVVSHFFPDIAFAAVQGRQDGLPLKPDPTAVLGMARTLGCPPEAVWYCGDTVTDMRCAKNAGMRSIAVTWGFQPEADLRAMLPDYVAHSAEALCAIIENADKTFKIVGKGCAGCRAGI